MVRQTLLKRITVGVMIGLLTLGSNIFLLPQSASAACQAPSTDYGSVSVGLNVPAATTYRIWTRMMAPDTTNTTYLLEIDGGNCYTVGGGSFTPSAWKWVDYQGGNVNSKVQLSLSKGNHTLKLIGNKPNVKIDRIVAAADLNCTPTGFGDNCNAPADSTPPIVTLTAPTEGATVSGTVNLAATASDAGGISKVEFYDNSALQGQADTSSPYSASWDTTKYPNGSHLLTVKAYDSFGNIGTDTSVVTVKNGDTQAPSVPANVKATASSHSVIQVSWNASTDNTGIKGYTIMRDGVPIATLGAVTAYVNSGLSANTKYSYQVIAFDAAGNKSAASAKVSATTPNVPDAVPPSKPTDLKATPVSTTQINLSWAASTDNIGVTGYDVFRNTGNDQPQKVATTVTPSFGDPNLSPATKYTYYVVAKDGAGNSSPASDKVDATTQTAAKQYSSLRGTIRDESSKKRIKHGWVTIKNGTNRHMYMANRRGNYAIFRLEATTYSPIYKAWGYQQKTIENIKLTPNTPYIQNVTLIKR